MSSRRLIAVSRHTFRATTSIILRLDVYKRFAKNPPRKRFSNGLVFAIDFWEQVKESEVIIEWSRKAFNY